MSYYIGLSILSNNGPDSGRGGKERQKRLSDEARRMVSLLADRPIAADTLARDGQGRPFFPGGDVDFSISHSGSLAAVSLVKGAGLRTGCDVELVRPRARAGGIAENFFSAAERDYIFRRGLPPDEPDEDRRFFRIWTLKECYLKLRGMSVFDMAAVPSFIDNGDFACNAAGSAPLTFRLYELCGTGERYMLATAVEGAEAEQPEIRWFSPAGGADEAALASLPCKNIVCQSGGLAAPVETTIP